jgi:regulator of RNase E activity RraA
MVHGKIGFRIRTDVPRPPAELVARFREHATSNIGDAMGRFHFMDFGIRPRSALPLCGVAVTVDARPGDNLMVHKALEVAKPGDIVVVNTNGNTTSAVFGELMCRTAVGAKLGGIVVDGAIRDIDAITALGLPAYSRAVCAGGCDKDVVVAREEAEEVLRLTIALVEHERARIAEIDAGGLFKDEINETLRTKGVL